MKFFSKDLTPATVLWTVCFQAFFLVWCIIVKDDPFSFNEHFPFLVFSVLQLSSFFIVLLFPLSGLFAEATIGGICGRCVEIFFTTENKFAVVIRNAPSNFNKWFNSLF